jgi:hypothetical protein
MRTDLTDPEFVADGLLPFGLSLLAAKPKSGKSWLALQVAIAVAVGRPFLGRLKTRKAPVLYLALEDTRRRLKKRAGQLLAALGWEAPADLDLRVSWPRASSGGLADLAEWFDAHKGGLVIVDTLARFRDPAKGRGGTYGEDYEAVAGIKAVADLYKGAVLIIHHTRKGVTEDPFDEVSGTLGINGAADALMVLDRERGADSGTLYMTGRDLADGTATLAWAESGLWTLTGREDGVSRPEKAEPANRVDQCAAWLAKFLGAYAWPDAEVEAAAKDAGFTTDNVRKAKTKLRREVPALCSRPAGSGGFWWNWIGERTGRPADRPVAYHSGKGAPHTPQSPESVFRERVSDCQSGETEECEGATSSGTCGTCSSTIPPGADPRLVGESCDEVVCPYRRGPMRCSEESERDQQGRPNGEAADRP